MVKSLHSPNRASPTELEVELAKTDLVCQNKRPSEAYNAQVLILHLKTGRKMARQQNSRRRQGGRKSKSAVDTRKKRQEKYRKRTKSLMNKVRELGAQTDCSAALILRDHAGAYKTCVVSQDPCWSPSIAAITVRVAPTLCPTELN